jgi:uncharacterized protein YecE (DUF72 family)
MYPHWDSTVYPRPVPRGLHPLEFLADRFDTIEIPETFYRIPRPELVKLWGNRVSHNVRFQFTARLNREFTHERRLDRELVRAFTEGLRPLQEQDRLGCVLMQFPSAFRFTAENKDFLIRLRRALPSFPLVAELRHASWATDEGLGTLIDYHIGFCNLDQPEQIRSTAPASHLTWRIGYVKLHGRKVGPGFDAFDDRKEKVTGNCYLYGLSELMEWKKRIARISRFAQSTFIIFNNDGGGSSVINALQMQGILEGSQTAPHRTTAAFKLQDVEQAELFAAA